MRTPLVIGFCAAVTLCAPAYAQLNQNCTVSVLNRNVPVNADGTRVLPNVPANFGAVKARATCIQDGVTTFGESDFFTVPPNGAVNLPAITLGTVTPIPVSLGITQSTPSMTAVGQTNQFTVTATYPDNSTKNVTAAATGTSYTSSNPAIASISAGGLVTAVSSGTVVIQATNDGATGITSVHVTLAGGAVGGIPLTWLLANKLDPNDPLVPFEDPDRDGLTNLVEYQLGTDPNKADTDGDGLADGDEVNKYKTNPLLADTDGDGIPDGVEITTGTNPLDPKSYDLKKATKSSVVTPASFSLTTSSVSQSASVQLNWTVTLIDSKTQLDLTSDPRSTYSSSDLSICNFGTQKGLIFAGSGGNCTITITNNTLSAAVPGAVASFTPKSLSSLAIPGFANYVKVSGNYAYIAAGSAGLQVVDVTDRANPIIAASLPLPANANNLRIAGSLLYMASGSGLLIIDITNPLVPKLLSSFGTPDQVWDVAIAGNLAYLAAGASGLRIAYVAEDRKQSSLDGFWGTLTAEQLAGIKAVAMDMWDPYLNSVREHVPDADRKIVFDKFHVAQHLSQSVDQVRRKENKTLYRHHRLLPERLSVYGIQLGQPDECVHARNATRGSDWQSGARFEPAEPNQVVQHGCVRGAWTVQVRHRGAAAFCLGRGCRISIPRSSRASRSVASIRGSSFAPTSSTCSTMPSSGCRAIPPG